MAMGSSATMLLRRAMATAAKHVEPVAAAVKKPGTGHPKKKNLFDVARLLPGWGVGHKVAKSHWKPQTYYKLYDIRLRKDAGHGAAWGIYHEEGVEAGKLQKISGANKRSWKYIEDGPERTWESVASKKNLTVEEQRRRSQLSGNNFGYSPPRFRKISLPSSCGTFISSTLAAKWVN